MQMGLVNTIAPLAELEDETVAAGAARCWPFSPFALRLVKASFNAGEDGMAGLQQLAHDANLLFYESGENPGKLRDPDREKRTARTSRTSPSGPSRWARCASG